MSKPRYIWYGYVRAVLREYPSASRRTETLRGQKRREYDAVRQTLAEIEPLPNADTRRCLMELVYFRRSHTLQGAAARCHISERTAQRWNHDILKRTARHLGLLD